MNARLANSNRSAVRVVIGSTSQIYDRVITVFYADGNETENDIAVPPATENVCYGVWEQTGRDTFKMRHLGWVFDLNGVFMGTVEVMRVISGPHVTPLLTA